MAAVEEEDGNDDNNADGEDSAAASRERSCGADGVSDAITIVALERRHR